MKRILIATSMLAIALTGSTYASAAVTCPESILQAQNDQLETSNVVDPNLSRVEIARAAQNQLPPSEAACVNAVERNDAPTL